MLATVYRLTEDEYQQILSVGYRVIDQIIQHLSDDRSLVLNEHWELVSFMITSLPPVPHYLLGQEEVPEDEALLGGEPTTWPNAAAPARIIAPTRVHEIAAELSEIPSKIEAYREGFVDFWDDVQDGEYGYFDPSIDTPEAYLELLEPKLIDLIKLYQDAAQSGDAIFIYAQRSVDLAVEQLEQPTLSKVFVGLFLNVFSAIDNQANLRGGGMLFKLDSDVDKYGGFFWEDKSQHMALISSDPLGSAWKPPAIHSSRLPQKILKLGPPDFGEVSPGNYLMQPKVYEALKPLWADAGEAFEAETTRGPYLLFHVTNEIDGLDCDRSEMTFFDEEKTRVMMINRYKFRDDVIQGNHLFRIPQSYKLESFVTQEVKDIVEAEGFTGFFFEKIHWAV